MAVAADAVQPRKLRSRQVRDPVMGLVCAQASDCAAGSHGPNVATGAQTSRHGPLYQATNQDRATKRNPASAPL